LLKQLYLAAADRVKRVTEDVLNGKTRLEHNSLFAQFLSWSVNRLERWGAKSTGNTFKVSEACTLCNTCVNVCSTSNISREGDKLIFGENCIFCMRCLYICPQKAIIPHWSAKWAVLKDWYDLKKIVHDPAIKGEYVTSNSNWYFKRLYRYMNEQ
jgi:ferredoxin